MSSSHFCLMAAKNLTSFQLLPASLITDLLLFLGLPLFLLPWGFQSRAAFGISPSSFLNVWPIHLNSLFLISKFISSCPVTFHRSLLEIIFGHHILNIYLRHLFTKVGNWLTLSSMHTLLCTETSLVYGIILHDMECCEWKTKDWPALTPQSHNKYTIKHTFLTDTIMKAKAMRCSWQECMTTIPW